MRSIFPPVPGGLGERGGGRRSSNCEASALAKSWDFLSRDRFLDESGPLADCVLSVACESSPESEMLTDCGGGVEPIPEMGSIGSSIGPGSRSVKRRALRTGFYI